MGCSERFFCPVFGGGAGTPEQPKKIREGLTEGGFSYRRINQFLSREKIVDKGQRTSNTVQLLRERKRGSYGRGLSILG